jgi:AcrR family transcriptional regulator
MVTPHQESSQSSLREEHAAHTRQRLLQAAIDVIFDDGADELSLREVAKKAGLSAPTAYRHFPTKPELLDAVVAFIDHRMHIPEAIRTLEDFIEALPAIHRSFADNERLMRAYLRARAATDLRLAGRKSRARRVIGVLRRSLPKAPEAELQVFAAIAQLFSSSSTWELWRDLWGLDGERAGRVAAWAIKACSDALRNDPAGFARAAATPRSVKAQDIAKDSAKDRVAKGSKS